MTIQEINASVAALPDSEKNAVTDGYHTFGELYNHRVRLFVMFCILFGFQGKKMQRLVWRASYNHDGSKWDGWFILGIFPKEGEQITYHVPMKYWDMVGFAETYIQNPHYDGHTSQDVAERLDNWIQRMWPYVGMDLGTYASGNRP